MSTTSTDAAFAAVRATDPASLCRDGTEQLLRDVRRLRSWLDSVEIDAARRLRSLNTAGQSEAPESLIAQAGGHTGRDAAAVESRGELCDEAPSVGDALAEGDVTARHLDAINAAAKNLPADVRTAFLEHADDLMRRAKKIRLDAFVRECRELAKHLLAMSRKGSDADELAAQQASSKVTRWVDKQTGMHHTRLELDPIRDAKLSAAFNAALSRLRAVDGNSRTPWQQMQVNAFVNAVAGIRTPTKHDADRLQPSESNGSEIDPVSLDRQAGSVGDAECRVRTDRVPEATLLISYEWLAGLADTGVCETENGHVLPISTARRICCDAEIVPALIGSKGEVLDQGRSARTATRAQRRALRAMHRGCAFPGCGVGFDACRMHHVRWWWRDLGATDVANLLPVCEHHHQLVHEGRWELTLSADRVATWVRPDGVIHHRGTTIDRVASPIAIDVPAPNASVANEQGALI